MTGHEVTRLPGPLAGVDLAQGRGKPGSCPRPGLGICVCVGTPRAGNVGGHAHGWNVGGTCPVSSSFSGQTSTLRIRPLQAAER